MKKLFLYFIIVFTCANSVFALDVKKVSLNNSSLYLLLLNEEAISFKISNPNILQVQLVPTLEENNQQVLIRTVGYGKSYLEAQTKKSSYKYECNVVDGAISLDEELFEIEKPQKEAVK